MLLRAWPCCCWGERGGDRLERLGMLLMEGVAGMVRLGTSCARMGNPPGNMKEPLGRSDRPIDMGSELDSF